MQAESEMLFAVFRTMLIGTPTTSAEVKPTVFNNRLVRAGCFELLLLVGFAIAGWKRLSIMQQRIVLAQKVLVFFITNLRCVQKRNGGASTPAVVCWKNVPSDLQRNSRT